MSTIHNQTTTQPFQDVRFQGALDTAQMRGSSSTSYASSIESMQNRADCDDGCSDDSCTDSWFCNGLYIVGQVVGTVLLFPVIVLFYAVSWVFETIIDIYDYCFGSAAPLEMNLDPEAVEIGSHYRMNTTRRAETPDRIDWDAIFTSNNTSGIRVEDLMDCFDTVFGTSRTATNFSDLDTFRRDRLRISIENYVNFIVARDLSYSDGNTTEAYYNQLALFMKNLIVLMKDQNISNDRKRLSFTELEDASRRCVPRRLEEPLKQYRFLTNQEDNIDNRVREWLQMFKEDIITRYFQDSGHFHALNHARQVVRGWGLEQPDARADHDQYSFAFGYSRGQYYRRLEQNYLPPQVISAIKTKIDFFGDNELVNDYMNKKYEEGVLDDETLERIYTGSELNLFGTAKLLEFLGFIDPV